MSERKKCFSGYQVIKVISASRWETVANFITQHMPESKRSAKEVLTKAKNLQEGSNIVILSS